MSWSGAALDLLVVPALLWRRTRPYAFAVACLFHVTNVSIFGIGTFPWLSIAMTALFFDPKVFRFVPLLRRKLPAINASELSRMPNSTLRKLTLALLGIYVLFQVVVPLRQYTYAGNTSYTEDGHNFSWHMMLRDKRGSLSFRVKDKESGLNERINLNALLTTRQQRRAVGKPDMILALAHHIRDVYIEKGYPNIEVYGQCTVSFNGRPYQQFVDPEVNLAKEERHLGSYHWVLPLEHE
jgi:hypothetical protein